MTAEAWIRGQSNSDLRLRGLFDFKEPIASGRSVLCEMNDVGYVGDPIGERSVLNDQHLIVWCQRSYLETR